MPVRKLTEVKLGEALTLDPRGTGRFLVRIIDEGEGSSAVYPAAALEAAAAARVFPAGTHMYLDHAPDSRRGVHGERSIRDLASVLTSDAVYDPTSRALVGEAQAIAGWEATLENLAPHVGLSISGLAEVEPPSEPGGKPVVSTLLAAESVDWVVKAGRGGAVLAILESAPASEAATDDRREQLQRAVRAAYPPNDDTWTGVRDFDDSARTVWFHADNTLWQQPYEVAADDLSITLTGTRLEVRAVTQFVPVSSTAGVTEGNTTTKEESMPEISQAELDALHNQLAAANERAEAAEAKIAEAAAATIKATNTARITEATKDLPEQMATRIASLFAGRADEVTEADLTAAVDAEKSYALSLTESGRLTGFGATTTDTAPTVEARGTYTNAFGRTIEEN